VDACLLNMCEPPASFSLLRSPSQPLDDDVSEITPRSSSDEDEDYSTTARLLDMSKASSGGHTDADHDAEIPHTSPKTSDYDLEGLTLFEKKCVLINREIDAHGMGKYQWWIWGLCGFGYLLDLLWAQAFGLVLSPIQQEFGFSSMIFCFTFLATERLTSE
jgi:hypothetical protein